MKFTTLIYNAIIVAIFATLAYLFKHWWIVLFSAFFIAYGRSE